MKTPDITLAQILAALGAIVGLAVSQGFIDNRLEKLITGIAAIVLPIIWVLADSIIRHGRAQVAAAAVAAGHPLAPKAKAHKITA